MQRDPRVCHPDDCPPPQHCQAGRDDRSCCGGRWTYAESTVVRHRRSLHRPRHFRPYLGGPVGGLHELHLAARRRGDRRAQQQELLPMWCHPGEHRLVEATGEAQQGVHLRSAIIASLTPERIPFPGTYRAIPTPIPPGSHRASRASSASRVIVLVRRSTASNAAPTRECRHVAPEATAGIRGQEKHRGTAIPRHPAFTSMIERADSGAPLPIGAISCRVRPRLVGVPSRRGRARRPAAAAPIAAASADRSGHRR